jgi:RHS repeat-associated protein
LAGDGTNTYTWDARNQLASLAGPTPASFVYDPLGRRQRKTVNGTSTDFVYDGLNPVRETSGATTVVLLTGLGIDEYLTRTTGGATEYYLSEAVGSTVALTDGTGAVATEYSYEPFGTSTANGASSSNELGYTGRENDETGVYYYRARYYSPVVKRFLSEDPLESQAGPNRYEYVGGNPLRYVDPLGLTRLEFDTQTGVLKVDPERSGAEQYEIPATSGIRACMNNPRCTGRTDEGPAPPGPYKIHADMLQTRGASRSFYTWFTGSGDWGSFFVPMVPFFKLPPGRTGGFYLHGGAFPGSKGCIDVGGGFGGSAQTRRLVGDILSDPDKVIPIVVK